MKYIMNIHFGLSRSEVRKRFNGNRITYESRRIDYDDDGRIVLVWPWGVLSHITMPEPKRSWWSRLFA